MVPMSVGGGTAALGLVSDFIDFLGSLDRLFSSRSTIKSVCNNGMKCTDQCCIQYQTGSAFCASRFSLQAGFTQYVSIQCGNSFAQKLHFSLALLLMIIFASIFWSNYFYLIFNLLKNKSYTYKIFTVLTNVLKFWFKLSWIYSHNNQQSVIHNITDKISSKFSCIYRFNVS